MNKQTRFWALATLLICAAATGAFTSLQAQQRRAKVASPSRKQPTRMSPVATMTSDAATVPLDVKANATQTDWWNFGWQTFVALNWPAVAQPTTASTGISGQPDVSQPIGAKTASGAFLPAVWLTYRGAGDTFLTGAANPGPWNNMPYPAPSGCAAISSSTPVAPGFKPMMLDMTSKLNRQLSFAINDENEATDSPLIDQGGAYVVYDMRLNQSEYTYLLTNGYYDAAKQIAAFPSGGQPTFVGFPRSGTEPMFQPPLPDYAQVGALEIKAAWRLLDPTVTNASRYYSQAGYFRQPDGSCAGPFTFGLIGFHILRLTPSSPSTWFWATFEHVDNVSVPQGSAYKPALATPGTPIGNCGAQFNVAPPKLSGNVPFTRNNTPVNVCQQIPIPGAVQEINSAWQAKLSGTIFANYQLINTINPAVAGQPSFPIPVSKQPANTDTLANTTMETYIQAASSSCMDCHGAEGFPFGAPKTGDYQVFTFLLGNADSSSPSVSRARLSGNVARKFAHPGGRNANKKRVNPPKRK